MQVKRVGMVTGCVAVAVSCLLGWFIYGRGRVSSPPAEPASRPPALHPVTVAQFGDLLLYLPLYIAAEDGIFQRHGLDVRIVSTGGDDKTYAAVLSGSAQFGLADPTFVAIAHERGQEGKVVALLIDGMPNYGVALDAPEIRIPADLAGKTVASVPAPSTSYALTRDLFLRAGLRPSILQVGPPGLVPALQTKRADYAVLIEPWVSQVVADGGRVGFSLMDYYPHFALTGLTTSPGVIRDSPDLARKAVAALTEAVGVFYGDETASVRVARRRFPNDAVEHLTAGIRRMREDGIYPRNLVVTDTSWSPAIRLRRESGDLEREPARMEVYVDNSFAMEAGRDAGTR